MSDQSQAEHDARRQRLTAALEALPDYALRHVVDYRACIELCGRAGPGGSALLMLEGFVESVRQLVEAARHEGRQVPERVAGKVTVGTGV